MYHNSPPISPNDIDWNQAFLIACTTSRAQVIAELRQSPIPSRIFDKIEKAIENSGLSISPTTFLQRAMTDELYQTQLMAHPSRQGFHENTQIKTIDAIPSLTSTKAKGNQQKLLIPSDPSHKNWVDCVVQFTDSKGKKRTAFGSMKFARVQGSHQSRQIEDQKKFLKRSQKYIELGYARSTDLFFGIGDGDYFHPNRDNKNADVSAVIHATYTSRVYNGTTGQVIDWLLSF